MRIRTRVGVVPRGRYNSETTPAIWKMLNLRGLLLSSSHKAPSSCGSLQAVPVHRTAKEGKPNPSTEKPRRSAAIAHPENQIDISTTPDASTDGHAAALSLISSLPPSCLAWQTVGQSHDSIDHPRRSVFHSSPHSSQRPGPSKRCTPLSFGISSEISHCVLS